MFTRSEHEIYQKLVESDLRILREFKAALDGKASATSVTITFVLAAVGAVAGLVSVIIDMMRSAR
jgi:hypothetical protein